jgi:CheY-like chemotaxis protein
MNDAPVFIIDDDPDELEIAQEIWPELGFNHPLEVFSQPEDLIRRLREKINPFLIICDVNLRKMDGFALRKKLTEETALSYKSIPFVFWSTTASDDQIKRGYDSGGHGFFIKGTNYIEIKESLKLIMAYWTESKAPNLPQSTVGSSEKNVPE